MLFFAHIFSGRNVSTEYLARTGCSKCFKESPKWKQKTRFFFLLLYFLSAPFWCHVTLVQVSRFIFAVYYLIIVIVTTINNLENGSHIPPKSGLLIIRKRFHLWQLQHGEAEGLPMPLLWEKLPVVKDDDGTYGFEEGIQLWLWFS